MSLSNTLWFLLNETCMADAAHKLSLIIISGFRQMCCHFRKKQCVFVDMWKISVKMHLYCLD